MTTDNRTLVLIALEMSQTPVAPHRPGTFVCGYLEGDQQQAHELLNKNKVAGTNIIVEDAWLCQIGNEFVPMPANPNDPRGERQPVKLDLKQGFAMMPLTKMDALNGSDYGTYPSWWVFPKGTMITDLEDQISATRNNLVQMRSNIAMAPAGSVPPPPNN